MAQRIINGFYGSAHTPCVVFVIATHAGSWYCVEGSKNINHTSDDITDGVDVETVSDDDTISVGAPIESLEELETAIYE